MAEAIRALMFDAYSVEAALLGVSGFVPLERTASSIATTQAAFIGIHLHEILVAAAELERPGPGRIHIASLVVRPSHFRRGLATAVLRHILEIHRTNDVTVSTAIANEPAVALYLRHGFKEMRRWSTADGIPMITLLRRLSGVGVFPAPAADILRP